MARVTTYQLTAVLDQSAGQQNSGLSIMPSTSLRRRAVKSDPVGLLL